MSGSLSVFVYQEGVGSTSPEKELCLCLTWASITELVVADGFGNKRGAQEGSNKVCEGRQSLQDDVQSPGHTGGIIVGAFGLCKRVDPAGRMSGVIMKTW